MKKQVRFKTETEIIDRIEQLHARRHKLLEEAMQLDAQAHALYLEQQEFEADRIKKESERLCKTRHRIEDVQLPKLKNALAAFRTMTLPEITNDPSVILQ